MNKISSPLRRRGMPIIILVALLVCGMGCQTFRTSQTEADWERDRAVAAYVDAVSETLHWFLQWLPYLR